MRIDQPEAEDTPDGPHRTADAAVSGDRRGELLPADAGSSDSSGSSGSSDSSVRTERTLVHRTLVDASYRQYAIDQGCARVEKLERETITPAMRRIEADDPERHLVGLEHRLKERYRIEEKVAHDVQKKGAPADQAFADMKDVIRYTFEYSEDKYTVGVQADAQRMKDEGAEYVDSRNTWTSEQYKGINSWWRESGSGQLFEVQFHSQASFAAKQETHVAYERLRSLPDDSQEVRELRVYQREVNAKIPIPPGAQDIKIS